MSTPRGPITGRNNLNRRAAGTPAPRRKTATAAARPAAARRAVSPTHKDKSPAARPFSIVGIGASAGGLEAVSELLQELPRNPGMAFVVMQHLDPARDSALTVLLGRTTALPVAEARHNLRIRRDCVYVLPPNRAIRVAGGRLKVTPRKSEKDEHMPIDAFLESLAEQEGERAIGVILSGNGSDGTHGLLAVKAAGGVTFAQDENTAKFTSMPQSAVAAGCVDFVLRPDKIAQELVALATRPTGATVPLVPMTSRVRGEQRAFEEIVSLLRQRTGVDFTHYKRPTLERRIHRRIALRRMESAQDYVVFLRSDAGELQELFNDILIHVTSFFRDKSVFTALKKKILPRLVKGRDPDAALRVWVPGCSSGEEVYSLAIAVMEFLGEQRLHFPLQFFGTDINLRALDRARVGFYPAGIAADVSPERLRRFFLKSDSGYRISKSIREMCVFARQNLGVDPPFSNLDLVSCRNVLIYLALPLQRRIFPVFHYALRPGGFLLLGTSETTGGSVDLFSLADRRAKFYTKRPTMGRPAIAFGRGPDAPKMELLQPTATQPALPEAPAQNIQKQADRLILSHYSPAGVVINRHMEVLQFRGQTAPYLQHPHGEASLNVLTLAREGLMLELRAAINQAIKRNVRVRQRNIRVRVNGGFSLVNLEVCPFSVPPSSERFYLINFDSARGKEAPQSAQGAPAGRASKAQQRAESRELTHLRDELAATRETLQAIIEEQEATNEELRSANEEITSSNEELQSTNEELETAKEELQSTNEELSTLNDELESRNSELETLNDDLHNLMASINIPIVIVGRDLRIRRFTHVAEKLLNLIPGDIGRPITDIKMHLEVPRLDKLIHEVIDTLQTKDVELRDEAGHWWSVRVRPYKTTDQKIDGAVVAYVDVEQLKNPRGMP